MQGNLRHFVELIRTSYWFLPSVMTVAAIVLATVTIQLDQAFDSGSDFNPHWFYSGSAEGARQLLSTVAGSMITVAGVVFSVTVVGLSLASNQFGPRLLRNFMRDRGNQVVLGTFISTYVYCLLVLRTVRGQDGLTFVPQVSTTTAVVLALANVGVLIYFIHHASMSMQAPVIIANVSRELERAIDELFPVPLREDDSPAESECQGRESFEFLGQLLESIGSGADGYIEMIDYDALHQMACEADVALNVLRRPGHFVATGDALVEVRGQVDVRLDHAKVRGKFTIGSQQTPAQDVEFVINQLVEVAVRALSPGVNDPFTAITCIDYVGAALVRLAAKKMPAICRCDDAGKLRLVLYPVTFRDLLEVSFRQIRQYGRSSAAVSTRLLEAIAMVLRHIRRREDCAMLLEQARSIYEGAQELQDIDRRDVEERFRMVMETAGKFLRELDERDQDRAGGHAVARRECSHEPNS